MTRGYVSNKHPGISTCQSRSGAKGGYPFVYSLKSKFMLEKLTLLSTGYGTLDPFTADSCSAVTSISLFCLPDPEMCFAFLATSATQDGSKADV